MASGDSPNWFKREAEHSVPTSYRMQSRIPSLPPRPEKEINATAKCITGGALIPNMPISISPQTEFAVAEPDAALAIVQTVHSLYTHRPTHPKS